MKRKLANIKQTTWDKSKELRRELTVAERLLWRKLQRKQLGAPFRKQHPIDPYIVDFCCVQNNLIIEIDGDTHLQGDGPGHDNVRTNYLEGLGWRIVRYMNLDVMKNLDGVVEDIRKHL
ncbi:endonuclease domain-containing protein [bacterium]|nr:endonuclease domain-containing protein [bacterium]